MMPYSHSGNRHIRCHLPGCIPIADTPNSMDLGKMVRNYVRVVKVMVDYYKRVRVKG